MKKKFDTASVLLLVNLAATLILAFLVGSLIYMLYPLIPIFD